ncbi:MAG: M14 family zinc carboxypeptidase, partial [Acidobacteriota bacterium]
MPGLAAPLNARTTPTRLAILVAGALTALTGHAGSAQDPGAGTAPAGIAAPAQESRAGPATLGIESIFSVGPILQDGNDDGLIDGVNAAIVLGPRPSSVEIEAAAEVAARLGFETSAMDLPIPAAADPARPAVLVGAAALERVGLAAADVGLAKIAADEGIVKLVTRAGRPLLILMGEGEEGLRAAAEAFAGRLPHLWEPDGPTLSKVVADVRDYLHRQQVEPVTIVVPEVRVQAGAKALASLSVEVALASGAELRRARLSLEPLRADRTAGAAGKAPSLSYPGAALLRISLSGPAGERAEVELPRSGEEAGPRPRPLGPRPGAGAKSKLGLANLYTIDGLLGDSDGDLIPDRVDVLLSPSADAGRRTLDLAARLGLESTGIVVPAARAPEAIEEPANEATLILIGRDHPLIERLVGDGKLDLTTLQPGEGLIQVVPEAFGSKKAVVVTGADARGLDRALQQLAERFPHIRQRGKDRTTLSEIEQDAWRLLSGRSPAGQASTALYKLDKLAAELAGKDLDSVHVAVYVEKAEAGLAEIVQQEAARTISTDSLEVTVGDLDVQKAERIIDDEFEVASEVDKFWRLFRARVLPGIERGEPVALEARLSEPPEVRHKIERQVRAELRQAGAAERGSSVRILSAYKQGYSWLYEVVRPALKGKPVDHLTLRVARAGPPPQWKQQAMYTPNRWLMELFPIDEVLARDSGLDLAQISFEMTPIGSPTYEAVATAEDGSEILRQSFEPKWVLRSYFDPFPNYEKVRVTTGWIRASVAGKTVIDRRIITDLERFWDHFQSETLPAIYDYVMRLAEGKPRPQDAPFFGELRVEASLSEPDYRIGIDQEQIASMESLHEEIYFGVLHFFDLLGRFARGQALQYPGRVIPVMHAKSDGRPGRVHISFTGFGAIRPSVVVEYRERGGAEGRLRMEIPRVALERPTTLAALVADGTDGIQRLDLRVKVDSETDQRAELIRRARTRSVDQLILSAEQVRAVVQNLARLRAAGLYRQALAYHHLGLLRIAAGWEHKPDPKSQLAVELAPNGSPEPFPEIRNYLTSEWHYDGQPIVQWDTPIPPPEAYELLAKMASFPEATVYRVGHSYLGKEVWAMDLMPPVEASHWSQAKATTLKPTVIYSARQHANEVSSTSHVLKLAELLLTDPEFRKKLDKVNVVIHPITNPDGAQLAYDLYKIMPHYMLHAGYLGSLGVDVTAAQWDDDPIYPESKIRTELWRTWLPDIFLNPHGYPSHEWVQLFSEYAGWVRNRVTESRDWWGMRGWFMPGFVYLDDPE